MRKEDRLLIEGPEKRLFDDNLNFDDGFGWPDIVVFIIYGVVLLIACIYISIYMAPEVHRRQVQHQALQQWAELQADMAIDETLKKGPHPGLLKKIRDLEADLAGEQRRQSR